MRSSLIAASLSLLVTCLVVGPGIAQACNKETVIAAVETSAKSDWNPKRILFRLTGERAAYRDCNFSFNVVLLSNVVDDIVVEFPLDVKFVHQGHSVCLKFSDVEKIDRIKYRLPPRRWYEFCTPVSVRSRQ
jgi:hypothetical protein